MCVAGGDGGGGGGSSNLIAAGGVLELAAGWDAALWSRLAPRRELHWAVGLRALLD
jgi:hypothetical protein